MKAVIKNILIIVELILIIFLSVVVYFLYQKNNEAVTTMGAGSISTDPVSYTHLDVYKRQDKDIVFYSSTPQAAYFNYIQNFSRSDSKIESLRTVLKDYPCLLYTSYLFRIGIQITLLHIMQAITMV